MAEVLTIFDAIQACFGAAAHGSEVTRGQLHVLAGASRTLEQA